MSAVVVGGSEHMQTPETPAATHRLTNRSTESSLGHLPHSILAREVMRLKEAKDAVLRQGGGGTMEQAKALRVEIGQIEQQAQADTVALAQEVSHLRELLLAQREEEEDEESGRGAGARWQKQSEPETTDPAPGSREQNRFDAGFVTRVLDVKERLAATSLEHATPPEMVPPNIYNFLQTSSSRIRVILDRISTMETSRGLHREIKGLLRENAELRISVNDYTEGLLAEAGRQLSVGKDAAPSAHPPMPPPIVRS